MQAEPLLLVENSVGFVSAADIAPRTVLLKPVNDVTAVEFAIAQQNDGHVGRQEGFDPLEQLDLHLLRTVPFATFVSDPGQGFTLQDALKAQPLSLEQAIGIVEQVGSALDYAHRQGVVHGAVKPANILLKDGQHALLTGLGLTRITQTPAEGTKSGTVGTLAYLSPEQARGEAADARADVYALGVILYEMLTGHTPHESESPLATLAKRVNEPPLPPRSLNPALPESVEQIILQVLAINPADRYASAGALAAALYRVLSEKASLPQMPMPEPSFPRSAPSPPSVLEPYPTKDLSAPRSRPGVIVWLLIGVGVAVICGTLLWLMIS